MRVASLLPSATEIVCALGAGSELVGVSHECDYPALVRGLPVLTRSRIDATGSSRAIHEAVRSVLQSALSLYAIDEEALAAAAPQVILTQDLCEVCAVSLAEVQAAVARLPGCGGATVVSLRPKRLADVLGDVERVGQALGRREEAQAVRAELERRMAAVVSRALAAPTRPRVVTVEWLDPIMLGGMWMPELVAMAGGQPLGPRPGAEAVTIQAADLCALDPEVVLVKPCGFTLPRTLAELAASPLPPLPGARVYATDGSAYFNRPGPRLVESLEMLAACIHPERFPDLWDAHAPLLRAVPSVPA
ncbi:MAG: ABC transporter substrate-binding protein [Myxococcales bacterium]|nr:ABC transporter substrate-binding protein [Myxococcota bacterium]MDW8282316.1 ABC transporter substrate-binding protein [Myxococcales bacterium]